MLILMVLFVCFHFPPRNPPHKSRRVPPLCPFHTVRLYEALQ